MHFRGRAGGKKTALFSPQVIHALKTWPEVVKSCLTVRLKAENVSDSFQKNLVNICWLLWTKCYFEITDFGDLAQKFDFH